MMVESVKDARAKRVKAIREALKLSRREFADRFGVSAGTLQHWETPDDKYGLSEKAAQRFISVLKTCGVRISTEWLLHGLGEPPSLPEKPFETSTISKSNIKDINPKNTVEKELALFYELHENATHLVINDDGMLPHYQAGDYVAGIKYSSDDIKKAIDQKCIVVTENGKMLARYVSEGNMPGRYTIKCTNFYTQVGKPIVYDIKLTSAAPIIWVRKMPTQENL